jgi:hypothetical protein
MSEAKATRLKKKTGKERENLIGRPLIEQLME